NAGESHRGRPKSPRHRYRRVGSLQERNTAEHVRLKYGDPRPAERTDFTTQSGFGSKCASNPSYVLARTLKYAVPSTVPNEVVNPRFVKWSRPYRAKVSEAVGAPAAINCRVKPVKPGAP